MAAYLLGTSMSSWAWVQSEASCRVVLIGLGLAATCFTTRLRLWRENGL